MNYFNFFFYTKMPDVCQEENLVLSRLIQSSDNEIVFYFQSSSLDLADHPLSVGRCWWMYG